MFPSDSNLEAEFTLETESQPIPDDPPFKILLLGDWSGRESRFLTEEIVLSGPRIIDRDNFDDVFRKLNVKLNLELSGNDRNFLKLHFTELDDFHPDRIFQQIPLFSDLRELRGRLLNPDSFDSAAREVRSWFAVEDNEEVVDNESAEPQTEVDVIETENLLDRILSQASGESSSAKPVQVVQSTELNRFISTIVKDHIIPTDENEQTRLLAAVDEATSELMRVILHHPLFQALESAWRGVYMLVRQIETDVDLKIYLLDISKDELSANLKSVSNLSDSLLYQWLIRETIETPGGEPFAVISGNYTFGVNVEDVATLVRLAKLSNTANAPFISYIRPEMLGIDSLAETPDQTNWKLSDDSNERKLWLTLRALPEAKFLGLAIPRFLVRLPYGESTMPTETFSFEEFTGIAEHENYLWANPSFACTVLLAKSYRAYGWEMRNGLFLNLSDLPTHLYEEDGETKVKPCAEILFTESACEKLLEEGLMPLISFRNSDRIQLARFQSIASPLKSLSGRWS